MPVVMVVVDTLLKVLGGFAAGFFVRDLTRPRTSTKTGPATKSSGGAKKTISRPKEELKMVLCVNEALKMGKGKIGAQCAHAAVGVVQQYGKELPVEMKQWEYCGQPKIALKVQDDDELDELERAATAAGYPTYMVHDAGRTQIPAGSQTVLAIGPAPKSALDKITGHLRLL